MQLLYAQMASQGNDVELQLSQFHWKTIMTAHRSTPAWREKPKKYTRQGCEHR